MIDTIAIICGEYLFILPVLVGGVYFLRQSADVKKKMITLSVLALPLTVLGMFILNSTYQNPRPTVVLDFKPLFYHFFANNGFPSSHATLTTLISCIMYVFNKRIGLFLLLVSILVSISRVYLGLHHFVDIVGGILLAIVITIISKDILKKYLLKSSESTTK